MDSRALLFQLLTQIETLQEASSGLEGIDYIYVINLEERPEKWDKISEEFGKYDLILNRVSAINGWKIPEEKRQELVRYPIRPLRGGEIGCFLSHLSVYQDAAKKEVKAVWICEDDIQFEKSPKNIPFLVKQLTKIDPDWDILYTDYSEAGSIPCGGNPYGHSYQVLKEEVTKDLVRMHGRWGTHSILFSAKGITKVFRHYYCNPIIWAPIDVDIHYIPGLREYSVKESITRAPCGSSDTGPFSSFL